MGNNRFKLSDMIPNAWFYKLKDMSSRSRKRNGPHVMKNNKAASPTTTASQRSQSRYSHYFPTELPTTTTRAGKLFNTPIHTRDLDIPSFTDSPRRSSSKRRARRKTIYKPSPSVVVPSSLIATSNNNNNYDDDSTSNWNKPFHHVQSPDYDLSSIETSSESDDLHECVYSESDCDSFSVPDLLNGIASNCSCRVSSSTNDIIIDMNNESFHRNPGKVDGYDAIPEHGLAPILTKQVKFDDKVIEATESRSLTESSDEQLQIDQSFSIKEESSRSQRRRKGSYVARKPSINSNGIRLRVNSPKLASRKIQACARRSVSSSSASKGSRNAGFPDGFAVVKSSIDPQSDFRESMVEMIVENNIRASKDLEDLLACYLSLNSSEYHDLIVKAFEQIWYDMAQLRM